MHNTVLEYMQDMERYAGQAILLAAADREGGQRELILDRTLFYPQGGGQPSDRGLISSDGMRFAVESVENRDGTIYHVGRVIAGSLPPLPQPVDLAVDSATRAHHSGLQSAGHLLVNAVLEFYPHLEPLKGYHFPAGPYVEFAGSVPAESRDAARDLVQVRTDALVQADLPIRVYASQPEVPCEVSILLQPPAGTVYRVVEIDGIGIPCGGTHVATTGLLKGLIVRGIKTKKNVTRISYSLAGTA